MIVEKLVSMVARIGDGNKDDKEDGKEEDVNNESDQGRHDLVNKSSNY